MKSRHNGNLPHRGIALWWGLFLFRRLSVGLGYGIIVVRGAGALDDQEKQEQQTQEEKLKNWWHPPFYQGLIAVLDPTEEYLSFQDEHRLSKEALRIDVIVSANNGTIPKKHDVAKIFKKYNLFEYKAHNDSLTIEDYTASIGKGHLYSAFEKVALSDITITFAVNKYPRNVINYLKNVRNFEVTDNENGLSSVCGDVFPVQILICKKDDNIILRNLHDNLTPAEVYETIHAFEQLRPGEKNVYVERIILSNWNAYKEASRMYPTLKERFLEIEEEGWLEERDLERAKDMLLDGESPEKVSKWLRLSLDKVKALV